MKSLRDEIRLRRDNRTDLISSETLAEDFIRALLGFHRATHDFIDPRPQFPAKPCNPRRFCAIMSVANPIKHFAEFQI